MSLWCCHFLIEGEDESVTTKIIHVTALFDQMSEAAVQSSSPRSRARVLSFEDLPLEILMKGQRKKRDRRHTVLTCCRSLPETTFHFSMIYY
jgi:hypothetical protein